MTRRNIETAVADWLAQFEAALSASDASALPALFQVDSHWRDVLALTWRIETLSGREAVVEGLRAARRACGFAVDTGRTPPRLVTRAGTDTVEAIFRFETAE